MGSFYAGTWTNALGRIGLWLGSMLIAGAFFSTLSCLLFGPFMFFYLILIFGLPGWLLYLPFVMAVKDAEGRRIWTILDSGISIEPAAIGLWGLILVRRGGDPLSIWYGDPLLGIGMGAGMIFALILGSLTTSIYVFALKRRQRPAAQGRVWRGAI